jgi:hypothetical protein
VLLQRSFADGRLTQAELEERAGVAYAARTRAQLADLTADLPAAGQQPPRPGMTVDLRLLIVLLCVCPPAGLACWLLSVREAALLRAWLMNARPWQRLLAGAIVAGAGMALQVLSHLAGAVLVSAGVIFALPAISGPLRRTWVTVRRAFRCAARGVGAHGFSVCTGSANTQESSRTKPSRDQPPPEPELTSRWPPRPPDIHITPHTDHTARRPCVQALRAAVKALPALTCSSRAARWGSWHPDPVDRAGGTRAAP